MSEPRARRADNVIPNPRPDKWNLRAIFTVASVLAGVACISSLLLLWGALDSHNPRGIFRKFGLPSMPYGKIITMIYLKARAHACVPCTRMCARTRTSMWGAAVAEHRHAR